MSYDVQVIHDWLYPDEGWSMKKACEFDETLKLKPGHPQTNGWPVWHYKFCRPEEGSGTGKLPDGPILDVHTHIWVDKFAPRMRTYFGGQFDATAYDSGTMDDIRERYAKLGISRAVVLPVPTKPSQVPLFNEWLKDYLDDPFLVPFMGVVREMDDPVAEVHRCAKLGFKGMKLHPVNQRFRMDDPRMFPIYEAAIEENMVILFHCGSGIDYGAKGIDWDCSPAAIDRFYERFPYERAVMAHLGGSSPDFSGIPELHPEWPGYMDTAFQIGHMPNEDFLHIVREYGVDRILFGTDSPWEDSADFLVRFAHIGFTDDELRKILYDNAAKLLDLPSRNEIAAQGSR